MKPESKKLKNQLDSFTSFHEFKQSLNIPRFSTPVNNMLDTFFLRIYECYRIWDKEVYSHLSQLKSLDKTIVNQKTKKEWKNIPIELQESILHTCQYFYTISFHFDRRVYQIYIGTAAIKEEKLHTIVKLLYIYLCFINPYVDKSCSNTVNIFLFFIPDKKQIPHTHNTAIEEKHVNTAFTYSCVPHTDVFIYREEEWFRALIHESFHNLGLDFIRMGDSVIHAQEAEIKKVFPVSIHDLRIYETYCELWAEILNVMIYICDHHIVKSGPLPLKSWKSQFAEWMLYERALSVWQCVKLLHLNKISYEDLPIQASSYKEKTQGFSYYVLKSILTVHLQKFLEFCTEQCKDTKNGGMYRFSPQFKMTQENLIRYRLLFTSLYNTPHMTYGTRYMSNFLNSKKNTGIYKTMRMSLVEIEN